MDGRITLSLLAIPFSFLCAGCITTNGAKSKSPPALVKGMSVEEAPVLRKADPVKLNIAFGKMKEEEADSDAAKAQQQAQAALRDEARKAYQQALKLDPNNLEAQRCLGRLYAKIGDFERSQEVFKKALVKHPKDATLWFELGQCHNRNKNFDESVKAFSKALELDPENRDYLKQLGFTLAWSGQVEPALTHLRRAYQSGALAHFHVACMFDQKELKEAAIHHLRLALRENGQLAEARDLLEALENPGAVQSRRRPLESAVQAQ